MNGFQGETVILFRPAFRNHEMMALVDDDNISAPIKQIGRNEFTFDGKDLRKVLDQASAFSLVKVEVPAYNDDELMEPLDIA